MTALARVLGRRDLTGILLNAMIGAGMLAAPSRVFGLAEGWSLVILAASGAILLPLILCFAELGSRFTTTGGPYVYAREALPAPVAFLAGWLLWISQALGIATLTNLLISYLDGLAPGLAAPGPRAALIVALAVTLGALVLSGIRQSATASNALILVKLVFVLGFLAAGLTWIEPERLAPTAAPPTAPIFAQAMLVFIFAASGFERGTVMAGEACDPRRDVPASLLTALVVALAAYGAVLAVCVGVLAHPDATDRPLAEVGLALFGPGGQILASLGACVVILGTILSLLMAMPRVLVGLTEHGQLPAILGRIDPRTATPRIAILLSAVAGFGAALASDLLGALTFSTAARVLVYLICCVALWRLSRRIDAPSPAFRLPGAGLIALLTAAIFSGVLAFGAAKELPMLAGAIAVGLILMALARRRATPAPDPQNRS